jgi:SAM-dependent methyltransferase
MTEREGGPAATARADELIVRFLADRNDRTMHAYTTDLDSFARFLGTTPAGAVARLIAAGSDAGRRIILEYMIDMRRQNRALSTIERRLGTLRAVLRSAHRVGLIDWEVDVPGEQEVSMAMEQPPVSADNHYLFPRHPGEIDRLDIQHHALKGTLQANHLAPVDRPDRVLDVGCGTGQWGFEMCQPLGPALVVGLDLVPSKPAQPPQYRYVRGNVMHGLPFADGQFDFVHQRLLVSGLPLASWPGVVGDLARVTRPGGWVELVEVPWEIERAGPAAQRLVVLTRELTASLGLDTTGTVHRCLHDYLHAAGMVNVVRRDVSVPVGKWGGAVGSLMVTDFRAGATRVCEVLQSRGRLTKEESRNLIQEAQQEWEKGQMSYPFAIAYAQKPG